MSEFISIEKAVEILELNIKEAGSKMPPDVLSSLKLSTNALKYINRSRLFDEYPVNRHLEGETDD